jgi:hypothetical protein
MDTEAQIAIATPKHLRTMRQKGIIFGDCNPTRDHEKYVAHANELVRRLDAGEWLSKADTKSARYYKKHGTV